MFRLKEDFPAISVTSCRSACPCAFTPQPSCPALQEAGKKQEAHRRVDGGVVGGARVLDHVSRTRRGAGAARRSCAVAGGDRCARVASGDSAEPTLLGGGTKRARVVRRVRACARGVRSRLDPLFRLSFTSSSEFYGKLFARGRAPCAHSEARNGGHCQLTTIP